MTMTKSSCWKGKKSKGSLTALSLAAVLDSTWLAGFTWKPHLWSSHPSRPTGRPHLLLGLERVCLHIEGNVEPTLWPRSLLMRQSPASLSPSHHTPQSQRPLSCPGGHPAQGEPSSAWGMLWGWLCPRQAGQRLLDTGDRGLPPMGLLALPL